MSQELDQMRVRREKMEELKEAGIEPFGRRFKRDHLAQDLHDKFDQYDKEELYEMGAKVIIAGRMTRKRSSGKAGFADFVDRTGKIQVYARKDMVGMNLTMFSSGQILVTSWELKGMLSRQIQAN